MDANIKKVVLTKAKLDENGNIDKPKFATFTIEVPMDSPSQTENVKDVFDLLDDEWVSLELLGWQGKLFKEKNMPDSVVEVDPNP